MSVRVVITGGGAVSPFGPGVPALMEGVRAGRTCLEKTGRACAARVRGTPAPGSFHPNVAGQLAYAAAVAYATQRSRSMATATP